MDFLLMFATHSLQQQRIFRDRLHPLDAFNDQQLIERYRFPASVICKLTDLLKHKLQRSTKRNVALPVSLQVCTAL